MEIPRVLSVQSHVVSGYVGNKSAVLPLQLLGFEVDAINSVQFSNHSGYKTKSGKILHEDDFKEILRGLAVNGLDHYTHLLTGYMGSAEVLKEIANVVQYLKRKNSRLVYVCDPVMGDGGRLYVPKEFLPIYKNDILPLADVITPNQYELELLTNVKIDSIDTAWKAIDNLHKCGCKIIVVSSTDLCDENHLLALASMQKQHQNQNDQQRFTMRIPKIPASFTGTGDLFTALLLAHMHLSDYQIKESLEKTVSTIQAILKRTLSSAKDHSKHSLELRLIASKCDIETPEIMVTAD